MSKKRHIVLGSGLPCPKCGGETQTRKGTNHGKSFYFSQYDYCSPCNNVIFNEKHKILATGITAQKRFDARIYQKHHKIPQRQKTEQELKMAKQSYGQWRSELNEVMKNL